MREGQSDQCMEVPRSAGHTQKLPDTFEGLSKALRETTLGQNMVVYLVDHPMNHPGSERRINRIHTPENPKSANAFFITRRSVDMAHCVLVQGRQEQGRAIEEWDQIYFGDGAWEVSGRRMVSDKEHNDISQTLMFPCCCQLCEPTNTDSTGKSSCQSVYGDSDSCQVCRRLEDSEQMGLSKFKVRTHELGQTEIELTKLWKQLQKVESNGLPLKPQSDIEGMAGGRS